MAKDKKPKKIEVEVEVDGREIELNIDPETGAVTIDEDDDEDDRDEARSDDDDDENEDEVDDEKPKPRKRRGLIIGGLLGIAAGAASAAAIARQVTKPPWGAGATQTPQDDPEGSSGGVLGSLKARWRDATEEGRIAAHEETQRKLARYRELTGNDPSGPAAS
jgi:hypothetical protein